ncbi:MAG: AbrB family transcriptional regulator [Syntrophales bacterium]|nr:AbrB family transcriptional regulator [Syntrophales bacterium]
MNDFTETSCQVKILSITITFLVAIPAGLLFYYLHVPLPWMLGPLTASLIYNTISHNGACWPVGLRNLALIVMGYSMGRTITLETTAQIMSDLPAMFTVTILTLMFSSFMGYITHRRTGISLASGMLGSIPGGLSQMILLTEEVKDADMTVVTFMQTMRLLAVVFIVPFIATYGMAHISGGSLVPPDAAGGNSLAAALPAAVMAPIGAWLACLTKMPTPYLLGPILGTAAAVLCGQPALPVPRVLLNTAQIFFGIYLGISITLDGLKQLGKVFPYAIGGAVALVAFTFLLGFGLTAFMPATLLTTFLGTAPGGIAEMGTVAIILHADIATVLAFQLFRLFSILLLVPPLLTWRLNR